MAPGHAEYRGFCVAGKRKSEVHRDYKARRFYIRREMEFAKYRFSDDCEGCRVAKVGAEAKLHSEGCRERIKQAMMNDDVGQARRLEQPSVATRVEAAQEVRDKAMNQALVVLRAARGTSDPERQRASKWRTLYRRESEDLNRTTRIARQLMSHRWASASDP